MITVDVLCPHYGDILRVSCEEDAMTDYLAEHVLKLSQEKHKKYAQDGRQKDFHRRWLCHIENRHRLPHNITLSESGIVDGSSLILV